MLMIISIKGKCRVYR